MVIAIDGPAGAGKSTVARLLAERLGFTYLDSGAMYRSLALVTLREGVDPDSAPGVASVAERLALGMGPEGVTLDGERVGPEIRTTEVAAAASRVSVHAEARAALVRLQREVVAEGGWVAEGRDIGTIVCPDAPLKIYLDASDRERAGRRAAESGEDLEEVLAAQRRRDERDIEREHGALTAAADAVRLDTTGLSLEEVVERAAALASERGLA